MSIQDRREKFIKTREKYKAQVQKRNSSGKKQNASKVSKNSSELNRRRLRSVSAVLSDQDIWHERKKGNIVIHPFKLQHLETNRYPITIGEWYYLFHDNNQSCINPWNKSRIHTNWEGPILAKEVDETTKIELDLEDSKNQCIIIPPHKTILTYTQECIGGLNYITCSFQPRELLFFSGLMWLNSHSIGNVGNYNKHPVFLKNTTNTTLIIPVGSRIGHVIFFYTGATKKYVKGTYQSSDLLNQTIENWHPSRLFESISPRYSSLTQKNSMEAFQAYEDGEDMVHGMSFKLSDPISEFNNQQSSINPQETIQSETSPKFKKNKKQKKSKT